MRLLWPLPPKVQWADSLYSGGIAVLHGIGLTAWHRLAGSEVRHAVAIPAASLWQQATALVQDVGLRLRQGQGSSIASDTTIGGSAPTMNKVWPPPSAPNTQAVSPLLTG